VEPMSPNSAIGKGSHSLSLHLLISLLELLFRLFQRLRNTVVRGRSWVWTGVHGPKPFGFTVFLVNATNRLFPIQDDVVILASSQPMCFFIVLRIRVIEGFCATPLNLARVSA
jgi:hypothetical protein